MRSRGAAVKFALFAGASILVTGMTWNTLQNSAGGMETVTYFAMFDDASGLRTGDVVRVAGVRAGRVDQIDLVNNQARVEFRVDRHTTVGRETHVSIKYQNLLGQRFLGLDTAGDPGPALRPQTVIPASRTEDSLDLSRMLNGFAPLLEAINPEDVNAVARSLIEALEGQGPQVKSFLAQFARAANQFDARDEVITSVFDNLTPVLKDISESSSDVDELLEQTGRLMDGLAEQRTVWGPSIGRINRAAGDLATAGDLTMKPIERATRQFVATSDSFLRERALLAQTIRAFPAFADSLGRLGLQGAYLSVYPCHFDPSVPGVLPYGFVSEFGGHLHTEACR